MKTGLKPALFAGVLTTIWGVAICQAVARADGPFTTETPPYLSGEPIASADYADDQQSVPPPPAAPGVDQSVQQRLNALEHDFYQLESGLLGRELVPGRLRSTDIHPLPPPKSSPSFPNVRVTGFFQADAAWFNQDTANVQQLGNIQDDRGFRRARLAAVGDLAQNVSYMLEMDFAFPGRPSFMDVWFDVHDVPIFGNIRVGQWRQPFGLDELTSVRELTFLERPTMFGFAPFRQTGIGFHNNNQAQTVTWAGSVFGFPTDVFGDSLGDRGYGTAERITALLWNECDGCQIFHVGADHCFENPNDAGFAYRNQPEYGGPFSGNAAGTASDVPFFINTGTLLFDSSNLVNLEAAGVLNHFHWQSELRYAFVNIAGQTVTLPSYYIQAAYLLTGEVRPYNKVAGVLGRIKPLRNWGDCGGIGAWEFAARYSYMNLNPAAPYALAPAAGAPPNGGALNDVTLGMNWYLNAYTKFQFNYIRAMLDRGGIDSSTNIIAVRAQMDF